jgi:beta-lactamase regulating signal transducer with metallopeptidase domain
MIDTVISSSVLILIILFMRFIFKGKIDPMVQYGLWSLVALRLTAFVWLDLHPVKSILSVMNITGSATEAIRQASAVDQVIANGAKAGAIDSAVLIMDNVKTGVMVSGSGIPAAASIDWQLVLMAVWASGTISLGLWLILVNLKFCRGVYGNRTYLTSVGTAKGKVMPVYLAESLDSPCLLGYGGEEAIYVTPEVAADKEKLHYSIMHELCHNKHHDLIWSVVRGGLLAFYWFNPLVWVAAIVSKRDCELACDHAVIKEIGEQNRLAYGKTLVDLISQGERKRNALRMSTAMYGSANGIKERVDMIVKNNKMKAPTLVLVLLIAALSAGFTFTAAPDRINDLRTDETAEIGAFATKWADAVSGRDAKTIHGLCENEELYLTIGGVSENGQYWMGMSSPWPWDRDYVTDNLDPSTVSIYYYFRTSSPTVYVAKETIKIKKIEGEYKATEDRWMHFDQIKSKADFDEAYKFGFPQMAEYAAAYQFQAEDDADYNRGRKEILEDPATAAMDQLNLKEAKITGRYVDPYAKKAVVKFSWKDGEATVDLIQPMITDESGVKRQATIWIVSNEGVLK